MKYYLHYVGSKLYPKEIFIKEAEKFGVNRCLPLRMIKKLSWGDRILLASFIPKELPDKCIKVGSVEKMEEEIKNINAAIKDHRKNKTGGKADIFGYFDIRGINLIASDEFKKTLTSQLNIIESKEVNSKVQRQCGSYVVGTSHVVMDSIKDIIEKALQLLKAGQFIQEKIKFFIAGRFFLYNAIIEPATFTRTIIEVNIDKLPEKETIKETTLGEIKDYNKRAYIKKYATRGRPKKK